MTDDREGVLFGYVYIVGQSNLSGAVAATLFDKFCLGLYFWINIM